MQKRSKLLLLVALLIPLFLVFRQIFVGRQVAWGDAPHFFVQELHELVFEPQAWTSRGNNFGGVNKYIFIWPVMFIYGLLGKIGFDSESIIRLLFYLPSILCSLAGVFLITRKLGFKFKSQFIAMLLYVLNTYYILLIDGGQVGIALAYGLFPLFFYFVSNFYEKNSVSNCFSASLVGFLLTVADPRVSVLAFIFVFLYSPKNIVKLIVLGFIQLALSMYWIIPLIKNGGDFQGLIHDSSSTVSFFHPLTLFQSHWPENIFGMTHNPPFYFFFLPLFFVLSFFLVKSKKTKYVYFALFLLFAFLAKGEYGTLGFIYTTIVNKVPFGFAFRDSTKFYVPLILVSAIMLGYLIQNTKSILLIVAVYVYLLILIYPALFGNLNFVLSGHRHSQDFEKISNRLAEQQNFFRTAWFPERHPYTFETDIHPALDAKDLVDTLPLNSLNVGSYDHFNYLNNLDYLPWYRLFGIKYLVLSGNQRMVDLDDNQLEDEKRLQDLVATSSGLIKQNWGTDTQIYEVADTFPHIFGVEKLVGIVGPAPKLDGKNPPPMVFFEDGILDSRNIDLSNIPHEAFSIFLNGKEKIDLQMSYLKKFFLENDVADSEWAFYPSSERLLWKYQLLIRGIDTKEYDYSSGVFLSTNSSEKIIYSSNVESSGEYVLAIRSLAKEGSVINIELGGNSYKISPSRENEFYWFTQNVSLQKGKQNIVVDNGQGVNVLNVIGLIPKIEWDESLSTLNSLDDYLIDTLDIDSLNKFLPLESTAESPTRYKVEIPSEVNWVVFSDKYNDKWGLSKNKAISPSIPFYSTVNGFYKDSKWEDATISFEGQEDLRWGIYWSIASLVTLLLVALYFHEK